ncbi:MAG: N4-gp56 family major capsid protein [Clostridia bacterium]|nr:N4-gp56 family major capsid protein [Clostridia bacterium]
MTDTEKLLNMQTTTSKGTSPAFQDVLNRHILKKAETKLVHDQFGQKVQIPRGKTKTIAWDRLSPLPKATKPLTEGITPKGSTINITRITAQPVQYGNYVSYTDSFDFFKNDPSPEVLKMNDLLGRNAAETLDDITKDVLAAGTNVLYAGGVASRAELSSGLTVTDIRKAVNQLKRNKAVPFDDGYYVAIVHPDVTFDIQSDENWKKPHEYADTKNIYKGEIGELYGVRFVETPDAKVFRGTDLAENRSELTVQSIDADNKRIYIMEDISSAEASALIGRSIIAGGFIYVVESATAGENGEAYVTLSEAPDASIEIDTAIYPADGGGANNSPVYGNLFIAKDAYGVTSPKANIENITKALGSAGSSDPLNQRGTMSWKAYHLAKILEPLYLLRYESLSTLTKM